MDNYFGFVFTILFVTLGPLKTIPVFYALTSQALYRYQAALALRATIVATVIVAAIALIATGTMEKWRVSVDAIAIAGGIILFVTALHSIMDFKLAEPPPEQSQKDAPVPKLTWRGKPTLSPLAIPTIVTPAAVVAILFFLSRSEGNPQLHQTVLMLLGLMMVLNLLGMLLAGPIMRVIGLAPLQIVGWIFAVLQAGLAVQTVLDTLRRLQTIP